MIDKLLSTAIRLYLRSQVSQVQGLQVKIKGQNRQILKGYIPDVFLACQNAVYQGLHLSQIQVQGSEIAFNLPEVLHKRPLRLLEPIVIAVNLNLDNHDLQASVDSKLLQSGLQDLWQIIVTQTNFFTTINKLHFTKLVWYDLAIIKGQLRLSGWYQDELDESRQINLGTYLSLSNSHTLCLSEINISVPEDTITRLPEPIEIDLGTEANLEQLTVLSEEIIFAGKFTVR